MEPPKYRAEAPGDAIRGARREAPARCRGTALNPGVREQRVAEIDTVTGAAEGEEGARAGIGARQGGCFRRRSLRAAAASRASGRGHAHIPSTSTVNPDDGAPGDAVDDAVETVVFDALCMPPVPVGRARRRASTRGRAASHLVGSGHCEACNGCTLPQNAMRVPIDPFSDPVTVKTSTVTGQMSDIYTPGVRVRTYERD